MCVCVPIHSYTIHTLYIHLFSHSHKSYGEKKKEEKRRASCSQTFSTSPPHFTRCAYSALPKVPPLLKKKKKKSYYDKKKKGRSFLRASQGGAHTPVATRAFPSRSVRMAVCLSFSRPAAASPRFTSPPPPSFFFFSSSLLPSVYRRRRREAETRERHRRERKKENSQPAHERKGDRERENTKDKTAFSAAKIA